MAEKFMNPVTFKKEVEVVISPQAQKILASTKYSLDDFKQWALVEQKISLGGNNVSIFLEAMFNKEQTEVKEDGSTPSD